MSRRRGIISRLGPSISGVPIEMTNSIGMKLALIPPGEFMMGSPDSDDSAGQDEKPLHKVTITQPFYLGKYEITQEQWEAVMGNNPSNFKDPKNPVEQVSWDDCQQFLAKLNAKSLPVGGRFQLPTEAQWEYACRAGSATRYSFGDDESQLGEYAWFSENSENRTHPVGEKNPNAWGLYDMHGNVCEWCSDWYDSDYYANSPVDDPMGATSGMARVNRGDGWNFIASYCRSACRHGYTPGARILNLGVRVSRALADKSVGQAPPDKQPSATTSPIPNPQSPAPPPAIAPFDAAKAKEHQENWAKHLGVPVEMTNSIGMKLVLIPPGEFDMGSTPEEVAWALERGQKKTRGATIVLRDTVPSEAPRHRVKITKPFYLGMYHVTQAEYEKVMGVNPSTFTEKQMDVVRLQAAAVGNARSSAAWMTARRWWARTPAVTRWKRSVGTRRWSSAAGFRQCPPSEPPGGSIVCRPKRSGSMPAGRERRPAGTAATTRRDWLMWRGPARTQAG